MSSWEKRLPRPVTLEARQRATRLAEGSQEGRTRGESGMVVLDRRVKLRRVRFQLPNRLPLPSPRHRTRRLALAAGFPARPKTGSRSRGLQNPRHCIGPRQCACPTTNTNARSGNELMSLGDLGSEVAPTLLVPVIQDERRLPD